MRQSEGICGIKRWTSRDRMSTFTSPTGEGYSTELAALAVSMVFLLLPGPPRMASKQTPARKLSGYSSNPAPYPKISLEFQLYPEKLHPTVRDLACLPREGRGMPKVRLAEKGFAKEGVRVGVRKAESVIPRCVP